jgi:hypothetical protein
MTSKQKCVTHAQATLPRLRELTFGCEVHWNGPKEGFTRVFMGYSEEIDYGTKYAHIVSTDYEYRKGKKWSSSITKTEMLTPVGHTPTLGDWLELLGKKNGGDLQLGEAHIAGVSLYIQPDPTKNFFKFNLATNEPATEKDWDTLAELLNL